MTELCSICLVSVVDFECLNCLNLNCNECIKSNDDRCCFCNTYRDDCEREVYFQLSLLAQTQKNYIQTVENHESIKKCPGCTILIEKIEEDCNQIYCTFCKTVWEWESEKIVTDIYDIHNPFYYKDFENEVNFISTDDRIDRAVSKCLKMLNRDKTRYITDTYIYRIMLLVDEYSIKEFKNKIKYRYRLFLKYLKLKNILEDKRYEEVSTLDPSWIISDAEIRLPYI